jgi:hypothetical protein
LPKGRFIKRPLSQKKNIASQIAMTVGTVRARTAALFIGTTFFGDIINERARLGAG